jgi:hypothetical protein
MIKLCAILLFAAVANPAFAGESKLPALAETKIAAEGGNPLAQYELAKSYEEHGDFESAEKWYALAAQKEIVEAECAYGDILMKSVKHHEDDKIVERNPDPAAAVQWYTKAAVKGCRPAMVSLGHCFEDGKGVKRDYVEAYRWYTVAEKFGDASVEPILQKLILEMKVAEITKAQQLADDFVAKHPPASANDGQSREMPSVKSRMTAVGAGRIGVGAFNIARSPFAEYDKAIIRAVQKRWYALIEQNGLYERAGTVTLHFNLMSDGSVKNMELKENTAGQILELFCEKAVVDSAPFLPLPENLRALIRNDPREVNFTFYY